MTTILSVAKYITLNYGVISAKRLQKLCYYAQVHFMTEFETSLFEEDFQLWEYGPVCPYLYNKLDSFGTNMICARNFPPGVPELSIPHTIFLDKILSIYKPLDDSTISLKISAEMGRFPQNIKKNSILRKKMLYDVYSQIKL